MAHVVRAVASTSTSSGVLGSKFGASRPSTTTGRMPLPSLPVDSAISCSAQSPKSGERRPGIGQHELVDAGERRGTEQGAQPQAGVVDGVLLQRRSELASASSSSASMSAPARPLGTSPNAVSAE